MAGDQVVCVVCGQAIGSDDDAYAHAEHAGEVYPICGKACLGEFQKDPGKHVP